MQSCTKQQKCHKIWTTLSSYRPSSHMCGRRFVPGAHVFTGSGAIQVWIFGLNSHLNWTQNTHRTLLQFTLRPPPRPVRTGSIMSWSHSPVMRIGCWENPIRIYVNPALMLAFWSVAGGAVKPQSYCLLLLPACERALFVLYLVRVTIIT